MCTPTFQKIHTLLIGSSSAQETEQICNVYDFKKFSSEVLEFCIILVNKFLEHICISVFGLSNTRL